MSTSSHTLGWPWLAVAAAVGAANPAQAQSAPRVEDPQGFRLNIREASVGLYSEGTFEQTRLAGSDTSIGYQRVFLGPLLGLNLDGSVYHPNLLRYSLLGEFSLGWGYQNIQSGTSEHRNELEYLGRYNLNLNFLQEKPYATTFFREFDHTYRDYDFFSRVIVDTRRSGLTSGYNDGPVPVTVSAWHRDETVSGYTVPSETRTDFLTLLARNEHGSGNAQFSYTFNQYGRSDVGDTGSAGTDHTFQLSDTEQFGDRKQYELTTGVGYGHLDADQQPSSDRFNANANLKAEYTPDLSSRCNFNYDRYSLGSFESGSFLAQAELRHQLYDSLTTTLLAEGSQNTFTDLQTDSVTTRYGPGLGLGYTKALSATSRLQIDNTLMFIHSNVENTGPLGTVFDEHHSFAANGAAPAGSFFLNQPRVIPGTVVVTGDASDINGPYFPYQENLDYSLRQVGLQLQVERLPGSRILLAQTLLVDYRYIVSPSGSYNTLTDALNVRVSLWNNFWGLYFRMNVVANDAPPEMLVQNLNMYTFGTDVTWRALRAGAEYEIYDADFSNYRTARLFQSLAFQPDRESSLSVDFTESWTDYLDSATTEERYTFITRYHRSFTWRLGVDLEGGVLVRRGEGRDETLATCRPGFQYTFGKTTIKAGYNFQHRLFLDSEQDIKHMFYFRLKRVF